MTNAGQDDGLPTSVLREISYLKTLDHPNVVKVLDVSVNQRMFEGVFMNLKEYIKQNSIARTSEFRTEDTTINSLPLDKTRNILKQLLVGIKY